MFIRETVIIRGHLFTACSITEKNSRMNSPMMISGPVLCTGILIVAKNPDAHHFLSEQFKNKKVRKEYLAIVKGKIPLKEGIISNYLMRDPSDRKKFTTDENRGKSAVTRFTVEKKWGNEYALLHLYPSTGRTHQLRVHMRHIKCPIVGDPLYGRKCPQFPESTLMLHALELKITLPSTGEETVFTAPVPERFTEMRASLDRLYQISS